MVTEIVGTVNVLYLYILIEKNLYFININALGLINPKLRDDAN